jgi:hypothetical protein
VSTIGLGKIIRAALDPAPGILYVVDERRRVYAALSRDGSYLHLIRPLRDEDYRVRHEGGRIGALACDCVGFSTHGKCYMASAAIAFEDREAMPARLRPVAPETELEKAAARG